jgi:hypothetical protein
MVKRRKKPFNLENTPTCKTFFNITGSAYSGNDRFSINAGLWNISGFTNMQTEDVSIQVLLQYFRHQC